MPAPSGAAHDAPPSASDGGTRSMARPAPPRWNMSSYRICAKFGRSGLSDRGQQLLGEWLDPLRQDTEAAEAPSPSANVIMTVGLRLMRAGRNSRRPLPGFRKADAWMC